MNARYCTFRLLHALPPDAYKAAFQRVKDFGGNGIVLVPHQYVLCAPDSPNVTKPGWAPRKLIWHESGQVFPGTANSTPDNNVIEIARLAQSMGLGLWIKAHIDLGWYHDGSGYGVGGWRGYLTVPKELQHLWILAYHAFLSNYITMARSLNCGLVLGCELVQITRDLGPGFWMSMAEWVRNCEFTGPLTYAANWMGEREYLDDLWRHPAINAIGVDFYPPASQWDSITADMQSQAARCGKPIMLTEAGCSNYVGALDQPGADPPPNAVRDDSVQAAYWEHVNATWPDVDRVVWEGLVVGLPQPEISHCVFDRPAMAIALGTA